MFPRNSRLLLQLVAIALMIGAAPAVSSAQTTDTLAMPTVQASADTTTQLVATEVDNDDDGFDMGWLGLLGLLGLLGMRKRHDVDVVHTRTHTTTPGSTGYTGTTGTTGTTGSSGPSGTPGARH